MALLYHYHFKSYKEYVQKRLRGRSDVPANHPEKAQMVKQAQAMKPPAQNNPELKDDTVWKAVKKYLPEFQAYDQIFKDP